MKSSRGVLLTLGLGVVPAWAVLGEDRSSVSLDPQVLRGEGREQVRSGYKVHQITAADGTVGYAYVPSLVRKNVATEVMQ